MSKRFPPPEDDRDIMISHGVVTHNKLEARTCEDCQETEKRFEKALLHDPKLIEVLDMVTKPKLGS